MQAICLLAKTKALRQGAKNSLNFVGTVKGRRMQTAMQAAMLQQNWGVIECFHSRGQHICKFIGTKESVCIRKEFNSQRTGLGHQHGRRFIVWGHQYGRRDVMWKHSILACHFSIPYFLIGSSSYTSVSFDIRGFSAYRAQPSVKAV